MRKRFDFTYIQELLQKQKKDS